MKVMVNSDTYYNIHRIEMNRYVHITREKKAEFVLLIELYDVNRNIRQQIVNTDGTDLGIRIIER